MADEMTNCYLVNAPAGSGKTTSIKAMIDKILSANSNDNILCITYTNRAADELSKGYAMKNVFVGTIHSFLNKFMKQYFSHSDILNLYFETYGNMINERIMNKEKKESIDNSNRKYIEKYGELTYESVKKNIHEIHYNESSYNSLYYGGLSHDELINFSKLIFEHYTVISRRIAAKYQYVFIDEYQDTMADVLKIFYNSIVGTNSKLYLFGDKMQQIYNNYDGSFEKEFSTFDTTMSLANNYRSSSQIVDILNGIYNDEVYSQSSALGNVNDNEVNKPVVVFCNSVENAINNFLSENPRTLVLYLLNKSRFAALGAAKLYEAFSRMEKYSYERNYVAILTSPYSDNPDQLLKLLYCLLEMSKYYHNKQYGLIIQKLKANTPGVFKKCFSDIKFHNDKKKLSNCFEQIFDNFNKDISICEFLESIKNLNVISEDYIDQILNDDDNKSALQVSIAEPKSIFEYMADPRVSTQHGVKGESHDSVVFVADDSKMNPIVHMYHFFEMFAEIPVSLTTFNAFYYDYSAQLRGIEKDIKTKINTLDSTSFEEKKEKLLIGAKSILKNYEGNPYFNFLCKNEYSSFIAKPNVTNAKKCYRESTVNGVLSAYKLFYVGCSRARKSLTILIDKNKSSANIENQKTKFEKLGFQVRIE